MDYSGINFIDVTNYCETDQSKLFELGKGDYKWINFNSKSMKVFIKREDSTIFNIYKGYLNNLRGDHIIKNPPHTGKFRKNFIVTIQSYNTLN